MTLQELNDRTSELTTSSQKELSSFDKKFFIVSASVFTFTVTFIKDILPYKNSNWRPLLIISWFLMGISIATTIIGYFIIAVYNQRSGFELEELGKYFSKPKPISPSPSVDETESQSKTLTNTELDSDQTAELDGRLFHQARTRARFHRIFRAISILFFLTGGLILLFYVLLARIQTIPTQIEYNQQRKLDSIWNSAEASNYYNKGHEVYNFEPKIEIVNNWISGRNETDYQKKDTVFISQLNCKCSSSDAHCRNTCKRPSKNGTTIKNTILK